MYAVVRREQVWKLCQTREEALVYAENLSRELTEEDKLVLFDVVYIDDKDHDKYTYW